MRVHRMRWPGWLQSRRRRTITVLVALAGALAIGVPVALANHIFTDVQSDHPFHTEIHAIAQAGITTGKTCVPPGSPPTYCPAENVTREAMAAFMHRGFGRVALDPIFVSPVPTTETPAISTQTITPGLPAGALAGAAGFIKTDATLSIELTDTTGCPCRFRGALFVTGEGYSLPFYTDTTLFYAGERQTLAMTGAIDVTTPGSKTVEVRLFRATGSGVANAYGNVTSTYFPFGSTGGNALSIGSQAGSGPNATP